MRAPQTHQRNAEPIRVDYRPRSDLTPRPRTRMRLQSLSHWDSPAGRGAGSVSWELLSGGGIRKLRW